MPEPDLDIGRDRRGAQARLGLFALPPRSRRRDDHHILGLSRQFRDVSPVPGIRPSREFHGGGSTAAAWAIPIAGSPTRFAIGRTVIFDVISTTLRTRCRFNPLPANSSKFPYLPVSCEASMSQKRKTGQVRVFDASFMLSMLLTAAFYVVMYLPSMRASILQHYTTEHVVEYVIVWLFVWGIIDIVLKLIAFPARNLRAPAGMASPAAGARADGQRPCTAPADPRKAELAVGIAGRQAAGPGT